MKLFVLSRTNPSQKIYITFASGQQPRTRDDIIGGVIVADIDSVQKHYDKREVRAEVGIEPLGGMVLGGLLFLVDPIAGIVGAIVGGALAGAADQERVNTFNNS